MMKKLSNCLLIVALLCFSHAIHASLNIDAGKCLNTLRSKKASHRCKCIPGPMGPRGLIGPQGTSGTTGPTGSAGATGQAGAALPSFNSYYSSFNVPGFFLDPGQQENLLFNVPPLASNGITYDNDTGVFTVNNNGAYAISISSLIENGDSGAFRLLVNNFTIGPTNFFLVPGSIFVIINLLAGDQIAILAGSDNNGVEIFSSLVSISINQIGDAGVI